MRGGDRRSGDLFSYGDLAVRVQCNHPLRHIREIANEPLVALEREFAAPYLPLDFFNSPPGSADRLTAHLTTVAAAEKSHPIAIQGQVT